MCRLRSTTNASPRSWRADPGARRPRTPARPPYSWRDGWLADSHTNPTQTPPRSPEADEATGHDGPLDSLLTQIINGFFRPDGRAGRPVEVERAGRAAVRPRRRGDAGQGAVPRRSSTTRPRTPGPGGASSRAARRR